MDKVIMTTMSPEQLADMIIGRLKNDVLIEVLASLPKPEVKWISQAEACERLRCSTHTFKAYVKKHNIDVHHVGNSYRYREDQVLNLPKV